MQPFDLYLPTHLIFGKGRISELPEILRPYGKKILLTYGGGSIKKIGLYDKIKALLPDFEILELSGIAPNPKISSIRAGVEICRKHKPDLVLAVGGGSVLDASKHICAGAFYPGDPWDLVMDPAKTGKSLPLVTVLTLAATGSEYDNSAVISNPETNEKMPFYGEAPRASICDPEYTYTVSAGQTAAGAADIMSHTFEQYLVKEGNILSDAMCEGVLRTVVKNAPIAILDPYDYEARAQLMMASSFGCNGLLCMGRTPSPWVCHGIEHEISAYTDITHGAGLAIITPHWMDYSLTTDTAERFAAYGEHVYKLPRRTNRMEGAKAAIIKTSEFFRTLGLPSRLSDLGVGPEHFEDMADHVLANWFGDFQTAIRPVDKAGILEILNASL